jgi:AraC-like DNA-binding protein
VAADDSKDIDQQTEFIERRRLPRVPLIPLGEEPSQSAALVPHRFATDHLAAAQQFRAWQTYLTPLLDVRLPPGVGAEQGFRVRQAVWNLGGILLVQQSAPAFSYERSREQVRFSPIDHWQITILRSGQSWTAVDDRVAEGRPGTVEIRSLGQPFRGRATAAESVTLIAPVDRFAPRGGLPEASQHVVLAGQHSRLLVDFVTSVEGGLDRLTHDDLSSVRSSLLEVVFDTVSYLVGTGCETDQASYVGLMTRARRFIQSHLASEDLTPDTLSRELAISRTRLYELFESSGGVLKYIRERRLLAAHAMLADISESRKIADVAETFGFDSAANFSRAFTQRFGYSPSGVRRLPLRQEVQADANSISDDPLKTFENLLRNLESV